jgi:hypothetical protein
VFLIAGPGATMRHFALPVVACCGLLQRHAREGLILPLD